MSSSPIIVALDNLTTNALEALVDTLPPEQCQLKIGKELFVREGPKWVEKMATRGFKIFLDLKFHDIPNTTANACRAAADLGVWMVNVHASGGQNMMETAREALANHQSRPHLIAVTVLTSMTEADFTGLGIQDDVQTVVKRLAKLAHDSGLDGVVSSAQEASLIKSVTADDFLCVTPGIRLATDNVDDQARIMTPEKAIAGGSDYLVIGRPITKSDTPAETLASILQQIKNA